MLPVAVAQALRDAGLSWQPASGDRFVVADRGMDEQVFVLSDMTVEVHEHPTGPVIGFNGTVEWALDSLDQKDALWLPREDQLRGLLGASFVRLERAGEVHRVVADYGGRRLQAESPDVEEAYALALLQLLGGSPQ